MMSQLERTSSTSDNPKQLMEHVMEALGLPVFTEPLDLSVLMKADVDAAFRRIPVKPDERWMCGIAFMVDGQVWQCL